MEVLCCIFSFFSYFSFPLTPKYCTKYFKSNWNRTSIYMHTHILSFTVTRLANVNLKPCTHFLLLNWARQTSTRWTAAQRKEHVELSPLQKLSILKPSLAESYKDPEDINTPPSKASTPTQPIDRHRFIFKGKTYREPTPLLQVLHSKSYLRDSTTRAPQHWS